MNKKKILNLTLFSTFSSFILILGLIPNLGYITFIPGIASLQIIHVPVLIGIMFLPLGYSIGLGFMFGLSSFIASFLYAKDIFDYAFQNPLISILPRVLFAVAAFFIYKGLKILFKKLKNGKLYSFILVTIVSVLFAYFVSQGLHKTTGWELNYIYIIAGLLLIGILILYYYFLSNKQYNNLTFVPTVFITSSIVHSLLVLSMVALFKPSAYDGADIFGVILAVLSTNALFEALIAVLIGSPIVVALYNLTNEEAINHDLNVWCR